MALFIYRYFMNLYSSQPYWLMKNGLISDYSSVDSNITTDIAIIGAGISGALTAYHLRNAGLSIAVFDRRHVGMGSTAASTAFLQYEIDTPLIRLQKYVGMDRALKSYRICLKAIYDIAAICKELKPDFDFHTRPSLQHATYNTHKAELHAECELRKKHGFKVEWLEPADIRKLFGFHAPGAILSADAAEVDAYALTHALLKSVKGKGHHIFTNTNISRIVYNKKGVTLTTGDKWTINARKLIIACGYESINYLPKKVAEVRTTYALVSEPLAETNLWYKNSLVWETADPYTYFRIVNGDRILIGGRDDKFHHAHTPHTRINNKAAMLIRSFNNKIKHVPLKVDFSWAGAFAVTKDGLPYIGSIPNHPHTFYALGFGGNGITFSAIAAKVIHDMITGKKNESAELFGFNR